MKRAIMLFCFVTMVNSIYAQNVVTGNGYYEMILPKKYDKVNIEKECIEKAQLVAMEKAFGKAMSQTTNSAQSASMSGGQSSSTASFSSSSMSFVSGRWIKDLMTPEIEYFKSKGKDWIAVTVKGEIQQLSKEEIAANPVTAYDFLSLAMEANEMGNTRKALRYLESYIEKETIPFLEPHLLFIELMKDEEREDELKSVYSTKPDITFFKMLEIIATTNDDLSKLRSLYKLNEAENETNITLQLIIGRMQVQVKSFLSPMVNTEEGRNNFCQAMSFLDDLANLLETKYYKNNQYFISSHSMKNYLSESDVQKIKFYGNWMYQSIHAYLDNLLYEFKTKEGLRKYVYEMLDKEKYIDYSCNPEYRDSIFDKVWVELEMDSKLK